MCLLAAGCVTTTVQHVDHAARPAQLPDAVAVLHEQPHQPFTVIAVIEATGHTVFDGFDDLRVELAAETAKLGGDAVILGPEATDTEFIFILSGTHMIKSDRRRMTGKVIVYDPARGE
jgi:hypothetical protein